MPDYTPFCFSPDRPAKPLFVSLRPTKRSQAKTRVKAALRTICKAAGSLCSRSKGKKRSSGTFVTPVEFAAARRAGGADSGPRRRTSQSSLLAVPRCVVGSRYGRNTATAITITRTCATEQGEGKSETLLGPIHVPDLSSSSRSAAAAARSSLSVANPDSQGDSGSATPIKSEGSSSRPPSELSTKSWQTVSTFAQDVPTTPTNWKRFPNTSGQGFGQNSPKRKSVPRAPGALTNSRSHSKRVPHQEREAVKARHVDEALAALEGGDPAPTPLSVETRSSSMLTTASTESVTSSYTGKPLNNNPALSSHPCVVDPITGRLRSLYIPYTPLLVSPLFASNSKRSLRGCTQARFARDEEMPVLLRRVTRHSAPNLTDSLRHRNHYSQIEDYPFIIFDPSMERLRRRSNEIVTAHGAQKVHVNRHPLSSIDEVHPRLNGSVQRHSLPNYSVESGISANGMPFRDFARSHRRTSAVDLSSHSRLYRADFSLSDRWDFATRPLPRIPNFVERRQIPQTPAPVPLPMLESGNPNTQSSGVVEVRPELVQPAQAPSVVLSTVGEVTSEHADKVKND